MKNQILYIVLLSTLLAGCKYIKAHQTKGVAAEVDGVFLYEDEVQNVIGTRTGEDSATIREAFIHQWIIDKLVNEKAEQYLTKEMEQMVTDYRRSLCNYAYEKDLIAKRMDTEIADSTLHQFYETHTDRLLLQDDIFKGVLLIVPIDAPDQEKVRTSLSQLTEDDLEYLDKYAYQNASGYELFLDTWTTASQLLLWLPCDYTTMIKGLSQPTHHQSSLLVLQDTVSKYFLQITEKEWKNHVMPFDYAQEQISKIIYNQRQTEFLNNEHERLYKEAVLLKKVKIYE